MVVAPTIPCGSPKSVHISDKGESIQTSDVEFKASLAHWNVVFYTLGIVRLYSCLVVWPGAYGVIKRRIEAFFLRFLFTNCSFLIGLALIVGLTEETRTQMPLWACIIPIHFILVHSISWLSQLTPDTLFSVVAYRIFQYIMHLFPGNCPHNAPPPATVGLLRLWTYSSSIKI